MHIIFHDGTGRYIISATKGRDGTFFFSTARAVHFCFHDGTGRYNDIFSLLHRRQEHTALGTKAAVLQVKVVRRTYHRIICTISYTYIINGY